MRFVLLCSGLFLVLACGTEKNSDPEPATVIGPVLKQGQWRAVLHSPGGELPFGLTLTQTGTQWRATAHNASETLAFDTVILDEDGTLTLGIDHYESIFKATVNEDGTRMEGEWSKVIGSDRFSRLEFHAEYGVTERFPIEASAEPTSYDGKWAVIFDNHGDPQPAVAVIEQDGAHVNGTFLTPTGDFRFLEGAVSGNTMWLSCFDGGHAFLFKAELGEDDRITGKFWSRDNWEDSWTAERDENAVLADPYAMTNLSEDREVFEFEFPDLDGQPVRHDDSRWHDKIRLITIFGSWCPNCNDEAPMLQELYESYRDQGLEVIGLAFEITDDWERNVHVLKRFKKKHGLDYTILIAGTTSNKAEATKILGGIDRLLSYPTTLLIDRNGKVVSIHTGFTGPGTGDHYDHLKKNYHEKIKGLLQRAGP